MGVRSLDSRKGSTSRVTRPPEPASGYFAESRRPLASLWFVLPVLALYELGVAILGPQAIRNGADAWLESLLDLIGVRHALALPVLVIAALLVWHHLRHEPWRVRANTLYGMLLESATLGVILLLIAQVQARLFHTLAAAVLLAAERGPGLIEQFLARFVSFCGAGVYEEVLFRLAFLPLLALVLHGASVSWVRSWILAAVLASLAFSAAHHVGPHGEPIALAASGFWFTFSFRFVAGLFFSLLFVYRGFGIAVGTHVVYDMLAGWAR